MIVRWGTVMPVALGVGTVAAKVALSLPRLEGQEASVAITWLVVTSFVVIGLVLLQTDVPPANGWACLLVALATVPGDLNDPHYATSDLTPLGYVLEPLYLPATVALVLRYPRSRLSDGERWLVGGLVVASSGMRALTVFTAGVVPDDFYRPPSWAVLNVPDWWHDGVFVRGGHAATVLLLLYTGAVLVHRCVTASGLTRQSLAPLAIIGAVCAVAAAIDQAIWMLDLSSLHWVPAALIRDLSAAAIPVALLADLSRRRAASAAVSERVLAASRSGDTEALQRALRDVLVDRSLTVATATGHGTWVDATGKTFLLDSHPNRRTTVIRLTDGTPLVAVNCSASAVQDEALWRTAMTAVEVGTENIRLNADLLARMAELTESRARIVEAGVAERRRVERDLHDGAQQQLLGVAATLARADLVNDEQIRQVVDDARERLADALRELRQLARGIHPAALSQGGLSAALPSLCAAAPCPVEVHLDPDLSEQRPAPGQETAVYFLVAEALANIARYSHPSRVRIDVHRDQHLLQVSVHDDGVGGARIVPGGGLAGLADRVEALGGRMAVHSDPCVAHPDKSGSIVSANFPINAIHAEANPPK